MSDAISLRRDLQHSAGDDMQRRRSIIGLSLLGAGMMGAVTLLQTGVVKHLPDPPLPGFDSDKVNLSETAFQFGAPDGTFGLASYAANLPLAAFGGEDRAPEQPLVPIAAAGKAAAAAAVAAWFLYQMPAKEKAWCGYCIVSALASFGILALTLPEAKRAMETMQDGGGKSGGV